MAKKQIQEESDVALAERPAAKPPMVKDDLFDDTDTVDSADLLLPRVLLMQGLSKFCVDEKARPGEFRDSLDAKLLGNKEKALEFIPFHVTKTWVIFSLEGQNQRYKETVPMTGDNKGWAREQTLHDGTTLKRYQAINYYILVPEQITSGEAFPYVLSFRSTSYVAGRKLETHRAKYKMLKQHISSKAFKLTCSLQENQKGKYYVMDVVPSRASTKEECEEVRKWLSIVKSANVTIDEGDHSDDAPAAFDVNADTAEY